MNLPDVKTLSLEAAQAALESTRAYARDLERHVDEASGAPPLLVHLKYEGFPELELGQDYKGNWGLSVTCRYEHDDDRGGQFEQSGDFVVKDGKLCVERDEETADANDFAACQALLTDYFFTDGGL